jgi:hypothetical protein
MKHAAIILPDDKRVVVDASGSFLPERDATTRVMHFLPTLLVPPNYLQWLDVGAVELKIDCDLPINPVDGLIVRQALPNQRYFVGCSRDVRYGWFYPLPDGISNFNVEFQWRIASFEIKHRLYISLASCGAANSFTMDSVCWPPEFEVGRLYAWINDPPGRNSNRGVSTSMYQRTNEEGTEVTGQIISENIEIPAIKLDHIWTIGEYEDRQIHELRPSSDFKFFKELHSSNVMDSCPIDLFVEAIRLARNVPASICGDKCEDHPANRLLADWWQEAHPELVKCAVGFAMPWVRVEDDDRYWCGYYETPDEPMKIFERNKSSQASVGEFVLLSFYARSNHYIVSSDGYGLTLVLASGEQDVEIDGTDVSEHDEAWYALEALRCFPTRFPEAWRTLVQMSGGSSN